MDIYMQVENITDVGHAPHMESLDWILVDDCTFGFMRTDSGAGQGTDDDSQQDVRVVAKAIVITRQTDRATPKLNEWMVSGEPRTVALEFCLFPESLYMLRLDLTNAQLHTYQVESTQTPEGVVEKYQLDYQDLKLDYWVQEKTNRDKDFGRKFEFIKPSSH